MIIKYYDNSIEEMQSIDLDDYLGSSGSEYSAFVALAFIKGMLAAKCMIVDIR